MFNELEYQKQYREKNREKSREYHKKFYRENIEKIKEGRRKSYLKYHQKILDRAKEYRGKHADKIKESKRRDWLKTGKIQNEKKRRDRIENPEKYKRLYQKRHAKFRTQINALQRKNYHKNKKRILDSAKKHRINLKLEVFRHYSQDKPKCKKCGESEINFLAIDHIDGKKTHGHSKNLAGDRLQTWLKKNGYPNGFQVLCHTCNVIKEITRTKKLSQKRENVLERRRRKERKLEVLSHYSGGKPQCVCCGFAKIDGLAIDHINGRKSAGHSNDFTSFRFYGWLIRQDYPKNYRVLCHNCNSAKGFFGKCPHEL